MTDRFGPLLEAARAVVGEFTFGSDGYSAGSVGAAILTAAGNVYTGICIDVSCGIGFCAEHAAIAEMLKHRETKIAAVVAVSQDRILPPCGRCREFMMQLDRENGEAAVMVAEDRVVKLAALLPYYWNE